MPTTGARGGHVYHAMSAVQPSQVGSDGAEGIQGQPAGGSSGARAPLMGSNAGDNSIPSNQTDRSSTAISDPMTVDTHSNQSPHTTLISSATSAGEKHKFGVMSTPGDNLSASNLWSATCSSGLTTEASSTTNSPSMLASDNGLGLPGSKRSGTSHASAKRATPTAALNGMQGSLNRLTDIFAHSMLTPEDGTAAQRNQAMQVLQEADDGLSMNDKVKMISMFMQNIVVADTYLSLTDIDLRRIWLQSMLNPASAAPADF